VNVLASLKCSVTVAVPLAVPLPELAMTAMRL
jgi:hypothetical protein